MVVNMVSSLLQQCLIFISENSYFYDDASLNGIPNILLESLLSHWSAYDLLRLESVYKSHRICTSDAWKIHMAVRPEYFRNIPAIFQTEKLYNCPKERYLARYFQDLLAFLTYEAFDPRRRFHMCLHRIQGQQIGHDNLSPLRHFGNRLSNFGSLEAREVVKCVQTLTLFGKQASFLMEKPALLADIGKTLRRLVLHNPRDHMYPAIRAVISKLLEFGVLEHMSLFHSMLSMENMLDLLKLCAGLQQNLKNEKAATATDNQRESVVCDCSSCVSNISRFARTFPSKAESYSILMDYDPEEDLAFSSVDNLQNGNCILNKCTDVGDEIDLYNEAVKPIEGSNNSIHRLFTGNLNNSVPTCIHSLSIISGGYIDLDLESVLVEVLRSWHSLKKFALQSTWLQRKKGEETNSGLNLTTVLKDMIFHRQLSELVIEETRDMLDNRTSTLEILEGAMHGRKSNPMMVLKLKDLNSYTDFTPVVPSSGINYNGIVHLDLGKNVLSEGLFLALMYIAQYDQSLTHLGIAGCALNDSELMSLFDAIAKQGRLVSLDISDLPLNDVSLNQLINLIEINASLRKLVMVYCQLNAVFQKIPPLAFCEAISKSSISSLLLSQNRLGQVGVEIIESILLQQKPSIKLLNIDISYNTISLAQMTRLSNFLRDVWLEKRQNSFLSSLCLTGNVSGEELPSSSLYRMFQGIAIDLQAESNDLTGLHVDHVAQM